MPSIFTIDSWEESTYTIVTAIMFCHVLWAKKWTKVVFVRIIQAAITNALVIYNLSNANAKKVGSKDFTMSIARHYLDIGKKCYTKSHVFCRKITQKKCSSQKCAIRT